MKKTICFFVILILLPIMNITMAETGAVTEKAVKKLSSTNIEDSGIVFDNTSSYYSEEGAWTTGSFVGFGGKYMRYADEPQSSASWDIRIKRGIYKLYYWHCLSNNGATESIIKAGCTTGTQSKTINFRRGLATWVEIGTFFISDEAISVKVSGGNGRIMTSAIKFVIADESALNLNELFKKVPQSVIMKTGSQKAYVNGNSVQVPDVSPTIQGDRTLVPARFISESFGAQVEWDEAVQSATVKIGTKKVVFNLNSIAFTVNGEEKSLDQPAVIISGRIMFPIRAFVESIGKQVFWDDRGLIIISDEIGIDKVIDKDLIDSGVSAFD